MKIIITESQYRLISERNDNKYMTELNAIWRMFAAKFGNREYTQREYITPKGFTLTMNIELNTEFGDLKIQLTEEKNAQNHGNYSRLIDGTAIITIYNCKFKLGDEKYVNPRGMVTPMRKIEGIGEFSSQTLKHEMVHFIDDMRNRIINKNKEVSADEWYNSAHEINAEFLSVMNDVRFKKGYVLPETFDEFLESYKYFSADTHLQWKNLNDKKRKSLINRMYQYYTFLKDVFKKKKEKEANNI